MGKQWTQWQTLFSWALKSLQMVTASMKLKDAPWKKSYDQPRQHIKKQRHYIANKGPSSQSYGFSSSHVWMWELDYKENWALKNWCFWTVLLEKTLESPLDCKEVKPVNPKGNQSWIFIGRTDAEAATPVLWPELSHWKRPLCWERLKAGRKGATEDEMVGWHHQINGHEFEQALGVSDGQGSLACCSPCGCREPGTTELLNCLTDWDTDNCWRFLVFFGYCFIFRRERACLVRFAGEQSEAQQLTM